MTEKKDDRSTAIIAEALYLLNLLFPIVTYIGLLLFSFSRRENASDMAAKHLKQTVTAGAIVTGIFILLNLVIVLFFSYKSITALIAFEAYFIAIVPLFLIPGLFGLIKAMSGEAYRYPLLGKILKIQA